MEIRNPDPLVFFINALINWQHMTKCLGSESHCVAIGYYVQDTAILLVRQLKEQVPSVYPQNTIHILL